VVVRADNLPLVFNVMGGQQLPRGAQLRIQLGAPDLMTLDINGTLLERLDTAPDTDTDNPAADDDEDDASMAGPIAIAVDINESPAPETESISTP
jgi:exoribonuclease-2